MPGPLLRPVAPAVVVLLVTLPLLHPIHVRHQNPDQDLLPVVALAERERGGWSPLALGYPSAVTNLLRAGATVGAWSGLVHDPVAAWCADPWPARVALRLLAVAAAVLALLAVLRLGTMAAGGGAGIAAVLLLGTRLGFVRESHHGMLDVPAAALGMAAAWAAGAYVLRPRTRTAILAGALAGLAASVKWNLGLAVVAPLAATLIAPPAGRVRWRRLAMVLAAAAASCAAGTPALVLEPVRAARELQAFAAFQSDALARAAAGGGRRLGEALGWGVGEGFLACALAGAVAALARGTRVLWPAIALAVAALAVLASSPLALNRYALPLAAPAAVLAAYGLTCTRPRWIGYAVTALLVAGAVPGIASYLRLLAVEDTRVAAAGWLASSLPAGERVTVLCDHYAGPDVVQPAMALTAFDLGSSVLGPRLACPQRLPVSAGMAVGDPDFFRALYRGKVVVTCEHPDAGHQTGSTPAPLLALLEREGTLLADFPVERSPGVRRWEPFDRHYVPFVGAGTLARPGPRLRIWRVPAAAGHEAPGATLRP